MIIRLRAPEDIDLIAARGVYKRRFQSVIRSALLSYIRGVKPSISMPDKDSLADITKETEGCSINLRINKETDEDIVSYLSSFPTGSRADIVRTLVRLSLDPYPFWLYVPLKAASGSQSEHVAVELPDTAQKGKKAVKEKEKSTLSQKQKIASPARDKAVIGDKPAQVNTVHADDDTFQLVSDKKTSDSAGIPSSSDEAFALLSGMMG